MNWVQVIGAGGARQEGGRCADWERAPENNCSVPLVLLTITVMY